MASDQLYTLALQYRKTKLWKTLYDTELFAVRLPDGEIGYCCVMGNNGEHISLAVYVGQEGIDSFRKLLEPNPDMSPAQQQAMFFSQCCLQCSFENKDELSPEELKEARDYAKRTGISYRGKKAFPHFLSYRPCHCPWPINNEQDDAYLCEALSAAIMVAIALGEVTKKQFRFHSCIPCKGEIPLLEKKAVGKYEISTISLPEPVAEVYPAPKYSDELTLARLKHIKKAGTWACEVIWLNDAVKGEDGEAPYFPASLMSLDCTSKIMLPMQIVSDYQVNAADLLISFAEMMQSNHCVPRKINARGEQTYSLLCDLAQKLGIVLEEKQNIPDLDEAQLELFLGDNDAEDLEAQLTELLQLMSTMDSDTLCTMPPELRRELEQLKESGLLPPELSEKLDRQQATSKRSKSKKSKKKTTGHSIYQNTSYVISVSLGTGCYRHLKLSADATLYELSSYILDAFDFDNDHMHAFFMDNQEWSHTDAYFSASDENDLFDSPSSQFNQKDTASCRLGALHLTVGQKFKYLFDFGDEWWFQCRVLKILEEKTPHPSIIKSKGTAPEQYPDYDGDEW